MRRYHIASLAASGGLEPMLDALRRSADAGVEMAQIREKELGARALCALVERALGVCGAMKLLVNSRVDVALACGAHGVHLPAGSPAPRDWRPLAPAGFLIGVSCHDGDELRAAAAEGADFAVYGPVFRPLSKQDEREPVGLAGLRRAVEAVRMPLYALGGVTWANAADCERAGAVGVAGITLFL